MSDTVQDNIVNVVNDAAIFVEHSKRFTNATVQIVNDTTLRVLVNRAQISYDYEITQTVKAGEAWDVVSSGQRLRLVAQAGCGCGGMESYVPDAGYVGH